MTDERNYIPRLYGRQQDKPLKPRQARLMAGVLPSVSLPLEPSGALDPAVLFPGKKEVWLEVGFGGGEHLSWQAERRPDVGFIGAEPFNNGVAKLLTQIEDRKLDNVRVHHGDARPMLETLPAASLSRMFLLHPDPWPKKRHHKRRMVSPWFFKTAARLLRPGGELRIASDIDDYIRWTLMHYQNARHFVWTAQTADDWRRRPDDWPQTRYEAKALREGRTATYLRFHRAA